MELKIKHTDPANFILAVRAAKSFEADYGDRRGARNGVGYLYEGNISFYVYRLKSTLRETIVVCGRTWGENDEQT